MISKIRKKSFWGSLLFVVFALACSRQIPDPVSPPKDDFVPPTPLNLTVTVSDRTVSLSWSVPDTQGIRFYRLYKSDSTSNAFDLVAEVQRNSYTIADLRNGLSYYFKVSSVSMARFEGYASTVVSAVPNLYGVIINGGNDFTNRRSINLTLVAPTGTQYMQISDDSLFSGTPWENFAPTKSWELPDGDSDRRVYARYRNGVDQITAGFYYDGITLDTEAAIDSVIFTPAGNPLSAGDLIHVKLFAGEPDGEAAISIGQGLVSLDLYDDGTRGDAYASDGIYETNYAVANNLDFENAGVFGDFTDRAENAAQQMRSVNNLSIRRCPDAVSIYSITNPNGFFDRLEINWNSSTASDFALYRLYRSATAGVDSTDSLVRSIGAAQTTSLTDTGLAQNSSFFYKVYVVDNTGLWTGSDEVLGNTNSNVAPEPVILYPIVAPPGAHDRLSLTWSASHDQDFLRYELYRSYDNSVTTSDILLLASASSTAFVDSNLAADSAYYYGILTLDRAGNSSWSNTAAGRTNEDESPFAAILYPVNQLPDYYQDVRLQWALPATGDFQAFRVYSWRNDAGRADSSIVAAIFEQDSTIVIHHPTFVGSEDTVNYWYIVHTYDEGGNSSPSNAIRVHLTDDLPAPVNGAVIPGSAFLTVSWIRSSIPDFGNYRLLRDTTSNPAGAATVLLTPNQEMTSYEDRNTVSGRTYYYWLDVFDRRNHSSRTFLGSARW